MNELPLPMQNRLTDLERRQAAVLNAQRDNTRGEAALAAEIREWYARNEAQGKDLQSFQGQRNSSLA